MSEMFSLRFRLGEPIEKTQHTLGGIPRDLSFRLGSLVLCRETAHLGAMKLLTKSCVAVFLPSQKLPIPSSFHALKQNLGCLILARFTSPLTPFTPYIASIRKNLLQSTAETMWKSETLVCKCGATTANEILPTRCG
jgi:hypothetical protein